MLVVVHLVCRKDLAGVGLSHDEDVVEDLASDGADDAFAVGVHPGRLRRPDGRTLAAGVDKESIRLWDISTPEAPRAYPDSLAGHADGISKLVFSPDGRTLVSAGGGRGHGMSAIANEGTVALWDTSDPARAVPLGSPVGEHPDGITGVAFSPDGHLLAAASMSSVDLWDVTDRTKAARIGDAVTADRTRFTAVALSPAGDTLVATSDDQRVLRWDIRNPLAPSTLPSFTGHDGRAEAVAFSPDGRALLTGGRQGTTVWYAKDSTEPLTYGKPFAVDTGKIRGLEFRSDGQLLVSADPNKVILWDTRDRTKPTKIGEMPTAHRGELTAMALSRNGRMLATGGEDGLIVLWDISNPTAPIRTGQPLAGHAFKVVDLEFGPEDRLLASAHLDGTVFLWDMPGHRQTVVRDRDGDLSTGYIIAFGQDGTVLATRGREGGLTLWDISDPHKPQPVSTTLDSYDGDVNAAAFVGTTLVTSNSREIVLWDASDLGRLRRVGQALIAADPSLNSVTLRSNGDGQTLATVDSVAIVDFWNIVDPAKPRRLGPSLQRSATPTRPRVTPSLLAVPGRNPSSCAWEPAFRPTPSAQN